MGNRDVSYHVYAKIVLLTFAGFTATNVLVKAQRCIPQDAHGVQRKIWRNIKNGSLVSLKKDSRYPSNPTISDYITTLEAPRRFEEFYGQTLTAYFLAPETGNHVFYMACDDYCQLHVSGNQQPKNAELVIDVKYYTQYRVWESLTNAPSRPIPMVEGKLYYVHAIMAQERGGEHLSIGVRLPSGLISLPMTSNHVLKYPLKDINNMTSLGAWGEWTPCSKTCGKGLETRSRNCLRSTFYNSVEKANFAETKTRICESEIPCASPPQQISVRMLNHSSVWISWQPFDFKPPLLVGYTITYRSSTSPPTRTRRSEPYRYVIRGSKERGDVTIPAGYLSASLSGLRAYTKYCIQMVTITKYWKSPPSACAYVTTAEFIPSLPPAIVTALNRTDFDKIHVSWSEVPKRGRNGRVNGYKIRVLPLSTANVKLEEAQILTVGLNASSMSATLTGLESFTLYQVTVAAYTSKGTGPYSKPVHVETCRCPQKLHPNWWKPFPSQESASANSQAGGIFQTFIRESIDLKCGICHSNKRTTIDFHEVLSSNNGTHFALKQTLNEVIDSINSSDISFPLSLVKDRMSYGPGDSFKFLPVIRLSTGVVYINKKLTAEVYASMVGESVFQCWPLLFLIVVKSMLAGIILCTLESISYPLGKSAYGSSFLKGMYEYTWCAFISMTTVGYGDRYPRSIQGKIFTIVWFLVGSIMTCTFVASLASSLYVEIYNVSTNPVHRGKVGVVKGRPEHKIAIKINRTKGTHCVEYFSIEDMLDDLNHGTIDGILLDAISSQYSLNKSLIRPSSFHVAKAFDFEVDYGIGLSRDAIKLEQLFMEFLSENPVKIDVKHRHRGNQSVIELPISEAISSSKAKENFIDFFDPGNSLYLKTVYCTSGFLIGAICCGLFFYYLTSKEQYKRKTVNQEPMVACNGGISFQLITEQRELLRLFYLRCMLISDHLRHKHKRQRRVLLEKTFKQNQHTNCLSSWLEHFNRGKPVFKLENKLPENKKMDTMV